MISDNKVNKIPQKRRIINKNECLFDNEYNLRKVFHVVKLAIDNYNEKMSSVPPQLRVRTYEAIVLLQEIVLSLNVEFPENCRFARYRRFVLRLNGYQFLIKKLNKKGVPMNIKTKSCDLINNQAQGSLFKDEPTYEDAIEPLLYIGYKKNRFGVIGDLTVVYIDENKLQWTITENDLGVINAGQDVIRLHPKTKRKGDSQRRAN